MAPDEEFRSVVREYVGICVDFARDLHRRRRPLPRREVAIWVPEENSDFAAGRVSWTQQRRQITDWSAFTFAIYSAFLARPERQGLIDRLGRLTEAPAAKIGFVLDNGAAYAGMLAARRGTNRATSEVARYVATSLRDGKRRVLIRGELVGGFVSRKYRLDRESVIRPIGISDLTYVVAEFGTQSPFNRIIPQCILEARILVSPDSPPNLVSDWVTALRLSTGYPIILTRQISLPIDATPGGMSWATSSPIPQGERGPEITYGQIRSAKETRRLLSSKHQLDSAFVTALDRLGRAIEQPI